MSGGGEPAGWYPVALSEDAAPNTAFGTRLFGREIVVWRQGTGAAHVWEDRCPHRGMRLSFGFVRPGGLACLYHGWQFDPGGQCSHIPAHPALKVPGTIRAATYPAAEHLGMVWTHQGDTPPDALPTEAMSSAPIRSLGVRAPARAAAALLAVTGLPFGYTDVRQEGALTVLQAGDCSVLAGLQPASGADCILHIAMGGRHPGPAILAQVSAWAEGIRRAVEASWTA